VPFVRATDIDAGSILTEKLVRVDPNDIPWARDPVLRENDILVVRSGAYTGDSAIVPASIAGSIAGYDMVLRVQGYEPKFVSYCLLSSYILNDQMILESLRAAQPHLNAEELGSVSIIVPPHSEQNVIAAFLDRETEKIDALIGKKQEQIALLQKKRAALISQAVTKGLDPDVKMKDSGVEWLGQVPKHWPLRRLKYLVHFISGGTPPTSNLSLWNGDIPWVSSKDMKTHVLMDTEDHITAEAIRQSATNVIPAGSALLVARSGILRHTIPVAVCTREVAINQDIKGIIPLGSNFNSAYFSFFVQGNQNQLLCAWRKEGATVESLEFDLIANTLFPVPPRTEQDAITSTLQERTSLTCILLQRLSAPKTSYPFFIRYKDKFQPIYPSIPRINTFICFYLPQISFLSTPTLLFEYVYHPTLKFVNV